MRCGCVYNQSLNKIDPLQAIYFFDQSFSLKLKETVDSNFILVVPGRPIGITVFFFKTNQRKIIS